MLDFEGQKAIGLTLRETPGGPFKQCFLVKGIHSYASINGIFYQFESLSSRVKPALISLLRVKVFEKKHPLDLDDSLLVSGELVEEIFGKVSHFTDKLNENKGALRSLTSVQMDNLEQARALEVHSRDLFRGTQMFQQHLIETLNKFRSVSPATLPKMRKIEELIKGLEAKQARVFQRLMDIKVELEVKKTFKTTKKLIKQIGKIITAFSSKVDSPEFASFSKRSLGLAEVLHGLKLKKLIGEVR